MSIREKIREMIKFITSNFVAEVPRNIYDPEEFVSRRDAASGKYLPVTTTMVLLNACLGNNTLIEGGCGTSKTQLASVAGSLLFGVPYELYERRRVIGTEEASINDIYATHDLAELNAGRDVAYLYLPFYLPLLVVDELNRFSPLGQNLIREGIATGNWNYGNHSWLVEDQIVVSAINPESYGGTELDMERIKKDLDESEKYSRHLYDNIAAGNYGGSVKMKALKNLIRNCGLKDKKSIETASGEDGARGSAGRTTDIVIISDRYIYNLIELAAFVEENQSLRLVFILTDKSARQTVEKVFEKAGDRLKIFVSQTREDVVEFARKTVISRLAQ